MSVTVVLAHSGKCIELECTPHTRADAVQAALAQLTGIEQADQILMHGGNRVDGAKTLAQYNLPEDPASAQPVFLYSRRLMRPGTPAPPLDPVPETHVQYPAPQSWSAPGAGVGQWEPGTDFIPILESQLEAATAIWQASQQRVAAAAQYLGEVEAQGLSVDAACTNVELHYPKTAAAWEEFSTRFASQHAAAEEALARFDSDAAYLESTPLHPALARAGPLRSLADLTDLCALRGTCTSLRSGAPALAARVRDAAGVFEALRREVETLLLAAPSVDLPGLGAALQAAGAGLAEQTGLVDAVARDARDARRASGGGEEAGGVPGGAPGTPAPAPSWQAAAAAAHAGATLPRLAELDAGAAALLSAVARARHVLAAEAVAQLQSIAVQQGRMRDLGNRLALYREAAERQAGWVTRLGQLRRVPAAYKQCLAECLRRRTFIERYGQYAATLAEKVGTFREKEAATRDRFRSHIECFVPGALLEAMGLVAPPPHCQIHVPGDADGAVLAVGVEDVYAFQLPWDASAMLLSSGARSVPGGEGSQGGDAGAQPGTPARGTDGAPCQAADPLQALTLENARLRADLAVQVALLGMQAAAPAAAAGRGEAPDAGGDAPDPGASPSVSGAATSAAPAPPFGARWRQALAAKDEVAGVLAAQLQAARATLAAYEARIGELEAALGAQRGVESAAGAQSGTPALGLGEGAMLGQEGDRRGADAAGGGDGQPGAATPFAAAGAQAGAADAARLAAGRPAPVRRPHGAPGSGVPAAASQAASASFTPSGALDAGSGPAAGVSLGALSSSPAFLSACVAGPTAGEGWQEPGLLESPAQRVDGHDADLAQEGADHSEPRTLVAAGDAALAAAKSPPVILEGRDEASSGGSEALPAVVEDARPAGDGAVMLAPGNDSELEDAPEAVGEYAQLEPSGTVPLKATPQPASEQEREQSAVPATEAAVASSEAAVASSEAALEPSLAPTVTLEADSTSAEAREGPALSAADAGDVPVPMAPAREQPAMEPVHDEFSDVEGIEAATSSEEDEQAAARDGAGSVA
ncbi:ATG17 [Auxenochlorella protothecoides x Auxenochlorella symbiontica]